MQFCFAEGRIPSTITGTAKRSELEVNLRALREPIDRQLLADVQAVLAPVKDQTWPSGSQAPRDGQTIGCSEERAESYAAGGGVSMPTRVAAPAEACVAWAKSGISSAMVRITWSRMARKAAAQLRVELPAGLLLHLGERHRRRLALLVLVVRPVGGHRVEGVGHRHDPGQQRDLLPRQPVRVAGPVPALVVVADDRDDRLQVRDAGQVLRPRAWCASA